MKSIDEAIREKREALLRLQLELETLERARALLDGSSTQITPASGSFSLTGNAPQMRMRKGRRIVGHPMRGKVNPKSAVGLAVAVLREQSIPLHLNDILTGIHKRGVAAQKSSVASSLAKMSKHGQVFYRADRPNTFGLLEWRPKALSINVAN